MGTVMIPDATATPLASFLRLDGRVAVVTGGGRGIGAAIVARLAEAGASVLIADVDEHAAQETAGRLADASGRKLAAQHCDVTDSVSLATVADRAMTELGGLDVWVNNAGVYPRTGPVETASDEDFDAVLRVNVRASFAGARAAASRLRSGGVVVNLASTTGLRATPGYCAYATSKQAVVGLTRNLAAELAPQGIRVLAVAPGFIVGSPLGTAAERPTSSAVSAGVPVAPLGRHGVPDDVARAVVFCASDLAAWMTGTTLVVDGGASA